MSDDKKVNNGTTATSTQNGLRERKVSARDAFLHGDVQKSIDVHNKVPMQLEGGHKGVTTLKKTLIYGSLDGVTTTLTIISTLYGFGLNIKWIVAASVSLLLSTSLSTSIGDYLTIISEANFVKRERDREEWELSVNPQGEMEEMIEIYEHRGMKFEDAKLVISTMAKYKEFFIDVMMVEELGLKVPDKDEKPILEGVYTFFSMFFIGFLPLLPFIISIISHTYNENNTQSNNNLIIASMCIAGVILFYLGNLKSEFSARKWWTGGLFSLLFGSSLASISFFFGTELAKLFSL